MKELNLKSVTQYVENNIGSFHQQKIASLDSLKLEKVLKRKNPYLYRAKYALSAPDIVKGIVDAHISSNEETIFGDWLEGLAIFIIRSIYGGGKSSADGIDLEFDKDGVHYVVAVKSGPNWANKSQKDKMYSDFADAKRRQATSGHKANVVCINGCCYGKDSKPHKFPKKGVEHLKLCGQRFWEFISGNSDLYIEIIEPLGHQAKERNQEYDKSYAKMITLFTRQFTEDFCFEDGGINWTKLVEFNSGVKTVRKKRKPKNSTT